jgi:hypothetical protein
MIVHLIAPPAIDVPLARAATSPWLVDTPRAPVSPRPRGRAPRFATVPAGWAPPERRGTASGAAPASPRRLVVRKRPTFGCHAARPVKEVHRMAMTAEDVAGTAETDEPVVHILWINAG